MARENDCGRGDSAVSVSKSPCHFERSEAESRDLRIVGLKMSK